MSPELKDLLDDAARSPRGTLDVEDIRRRGRRGRALERGAGVAVAVLALVGVVVGVDVLRSGGPEVPVIGQVSPAPSPGPGQTAGGSTLPKTVRAEDLSVDVLRAVDGGDGDAAVEIDHPDGTTSIVPVEIASPSTARIVADDRGGFAYQQFDGPGGSPAILRVTAEGSRAVLVEATAGTNETYTLVGASEGGGFLVAHRTGTTPEDTTVDLLEVTDTGTQRLLLADVAGWESDLLGAVSLEFSAYVATAEATSMIVVAPPDRPATTVWEADGATGQAALGIAGAMRSGNAYALVRGDDQTEILVVDVFGETILNRFPVPVDLGQVGPGAVATEVSVVDGVGLLVNRNRDGSWLAPLITTFQGDEPVWAVYGTAGRALLARPAPAPDPTEAAACLQDDALRDAPPRADGTFDIYVFCSDDPEPWNVYRLPTDLVMTADVAADARTALDIAFSGVELIPGAAQRGSSALTRRSPQGDPPPIEVSEVSFTDATLVVDFAADTVFGNYTTSTGGAVFTSVLAANLFQIPGVETLEFRVGGSCEAFAEAFQGAGCRPLTRADNAAWNADTTDG